MNYKNLSKNILFKDITEKEFTECLITLNAHEKSYKKGELILCAGDSTDYIGMVLSGSVTIESNDIWGNCSILSHVEKNNFFAETYALLPDEVMLVDAKANEDCRILFLNIKKILNIGFSFSWEKKILKNLLIISANKNLNLSKRSFHIVSKSCRRRLLSYLNAVSLQKQSEKFTIPFDRQQLADYLNLERTNMSKELSKLQKEGIIKFRKNHFEIIRKK